jgi:hypothetical protein
MITASQARSMAETRWGVGGTHGYRTNRRGAFYYSCAGHGGYVIDARCLSDEEVQNLNEHIKMPGGYTATEIVDDATGKVVKFHGPENYRTIRYYPSRQTALTPEIIFGEEDCDWAVVEKYTDIRRLR